MMHVCVSSIVFSTKSVYMYMYTVYIHIYIYINNNNSNTACSMYVYMYRELQRERYLSVSYLLSKYGFSRSYAVHQVIYISVIVSTAGPIRFLLL